MRDYLAGGYLYDQGPTSQYLTSICSCMVAVDKTRDQNQAKRCTVTIRLLDWSSEPDCCGAVGRSGMSGTRNDLLGCDVMYGHELNFCLLGGRLSARDQNCTTAWGLAVHGCRGRCDTLQIYIIGPHLLGGD